MSLPSDIFCRQLKLAEQEVSNCDKKVEEACQEVRNQLNQEQATIAQRDEMLRKADAHINELKAVVRLAERVWRRVPTLSSVGGSVERLLPLRVDSNRVPAQPFRLQNRRLS